MTNLNEIVAAVKRQIVQSGRAGCSLSQLIDSNGLKVQLLVYLVKNHLSLDNYAFKHGELVVDISSFSAVEIEASAGSIYCIAPLNEIERHWGVEVGGVILPEETHLYEILDSVSTSLEKGCLVSETMKSSGGSTQVHGHIDKLIGLGLLVKRSILATSGPIRSRISSKSTVVHGSKYTSFYDELADGVKISAGNAYLDRVHDLILSALDQNNVKIMTVRDVARALGLSRWDLQALRNVTIAQKEGGKVKFFEMLCQVYLDNGTLSSARVSWCVSRADSTADGESGGGGGGEDLATVFQCSRSLPVNEAIAAAIASRPEGLTASDIRAITGLTLKRAAKLFTLFNKQFGYPVEKVQIGKQLVHKLTAKFPRPVPTTSTNSSGKLSTPHRAAAPRASSSFASSSSSLPSSAHTSKQQQPAGGAAAVADPSQSAARAPRSVVKSEGDLQGGGDAADLKLSDKQQLHNQTILEFLAQCEGNVANLADVMSEVRSQHKIRQRMEELGGATYTVDRRTIDRALQRLQHVLNQVTVVESVNPLSPMGEQTSLVILNPTGDDAEQLDFAALVAEYWQRDALRAQQAAMMDGDSKDSSGPRDKAVRTVRAKVGRPTSAVAGKRKRKVVAAADSDSDDSDSSYSDGAGGSDSGSASSGSEEQDPRSNRALWRDDSPIRAARRVTAIAHGGSVGGSASASATTAAAAAVAAAELIPQELRKSYRNRAIKQKKTFEDPLVFEEVAHPATEPAGWLVAAMRLHCQLVRALLPGPQTIPAAATSSSCSDGVGGAGVTAAAAADRATFTLADLLKDLPLGFLLSSNVHLRRQIASRMELESTEHNDLESCFAAAVAMRAVTKDVLDADNSLGRCLTKHVGDTEAKRELAGMVAALLAIGVLKLPASTEEALKACICADLAAIEAADPHQHAQSSSPSLLAAALDTICCDSQDTHGASALKARRGREEPLSLHSQQEGDRDHLQLTMQAFALVAVYLNEHVDRPTPLQLVAFLCSSAQELTARPVGAWQPVRSDLEIYHHWKSIVLTSLPISWEDLDRVGRLTNIARHCLHYHEVHGEVPSGVVRADGGETSFFDNKVKMSHWSNKLIQAAWADVPALPWTCVRAQQSQQQGETDQGGAVGESAAAPRTSSTFSLDMPRKLAASRKRSQQEGSAAKLSQSARKRAKTESQESMSALQALEAVAGEWVGEEGEQINAAASLEGDGDAAAATPVEGPQHMMDPGLEEEMQSLMACEDIEWTTRQVAIVLEAVLIHFFARPYHGQLQSALVPSSSSSSRVADAAVASVSSSPHPYVSPSPAPTCPSDTATTEPANSCFDINWADTDFASVSEGLLNLAIAATKLPDHQKAAKHRLLQCIKARPRLRSVVAWIACNKGSQLSSSFRRIMNQVLAQHVGTGREGAFAAEQAALSTSLQVYGSPVLNTMGVDLLQKHPIDAVSNVTRELFVRGFVRRPEHCGSDQCTARPCPHKKRTFVLSETFFETQTGVLLAPFYADLLERPRRDGAALLGPLRTNDFLAALQSELYCDSLAYKTLAVAQCVSAKPNVLSGRLGVQSQESLHMQTTIAAFTGHHDQCGASVATSGGGADKEEEVPLLGEESFEPHSGFCDKSLNQIRADFVLLAAPAANSPPSPPSAVPVGSRRADEHSPAWVLPDGSTNGPVQRALCAKVLAVLADKPGADADTLHTALVVLSLEHTRALLELMEQNGLVHSRRCAATAQRAARTAALGGGASIGGDFFGFGAVVFANRAPAQAPAAGDATDNRCYFASNILAAM